MKKKNHNNRKLLNHRFFVSVSLTLSPSFSLTPLYAFTSHEHLDWDPWELLTVGFEERIATTEQVSQQIWGFVYECIDHLGPLLLVWVVQPAHLQHVCRTMQRVACDVQCSMVLGPQLLLRLGNCVLQLLVRCEVVRKAAAAVMVRESKLLLPPFNNLPLSRSSNQKQNKERKKVHISTNID